MIQERVNATIADAWVLPVNELFFPGEKRMNLKEAKNTVKEWLDPSGDWKITVTSQMYRMAKGFLEGYEAGVREAVEKSNPDCTYSCQNRILKLLDEETK